MWCELAGCGIRVGDEGGDGGVLMCTGWRGCEGVNRAGWLGYCGARLYPAP